MKICYIGNGRCFDKRLSDVTPPNKQSCKTSYNLYVVQTMQTDTNKNDDGSWDRVLDTSLY
jgi:hypothetical protein